MIFMKGRPTINLYPCTKCGAHTLWKLLLGKAAIICTECKSVLTKSSDRNKT